MKNLLLNTLVLTAALTCMSVAANERPPVPVKVDSVQQTNMVKEFDLHGTVYGKNDVTLTASVGGRLVAVAEPGQLLRKGDEVARIDMIPLQLEKAEQEALIRRAQINAKFERQELARLQELAKTDAAAAYQLDLTQNKLDLAESDLELAELKLSQINDRIERATIRAPFDGIVGERFRRAGGDISRADQVVRLLDVFNLETRMFVPIKYLPYVVPGQTVNVRSSAYPQLEPSTAQISAIIPTTDTRSQTFEVRAKINLQDDRIWASGQLVEVTLPLADAEQVTLIHRDALIIRKDGIHIVKIDKENKAHRIPVKVGKGQGQLVEVILDSDVELQQGDNIAVRGAERLTDGQAVEIQPTTL